MTRLIRRELVAGAGAAAFGAAITRNDRVLGKVTAKMKRGAMVGVSAGPAVENWDFHAVLDDYGKRVADHVRRRAKQPSACRAAESAVGAPSVGDGRAGSIVGQSRERFGLVMSAWSDRQRAGFVLVT